MIERYSKEMEWLELGYRLERADKKQHDYLLGWMRTYVHAAETVVASKNSSQDLAPVKPRAKSSR